MCGCKIEFAYPIVHKVIYCHYHDSTDRFREALGAVKSVISRYKNDKDMVELLALVHYALNKTEEVEWKGHGRAPVEKKEEKRIWSDFG